MTRHVLVVDDDDEIRETIAEVLADYGAEVTTAVHGRDALDRLIAGLRPHVILLDLMMPVLDGRAFFEALKRDPELSHLPVVVLSAYHDLQHIAEELGVTSFLPKPLDIASLVAAVERYSLPSA